MGSIGFLCRSPLDYFIYKNTYKYLRELGIEGVDLIVKRIHGIAIVESYADKFYEYVCKEIEDRGEEYIKDPSPSWAIEDGYKVIVYNNNGLFTTAKKIRMLYSHAKENHTMGTFACSEFDLILTYGERSNAACSRFADTEIIGNPKYDDWFTGNVADVELSGLDKNKKTILYVPTWGEIGSCDTYYEAINSLADRYNVILKCHDSLYWREPEKLKKFSNQKIIVLNGDSDIQSLFKKADVVMGDNSGAMIESLLTDKPTIFLEVENAGNSDATSSNSIERVCGSKFLLVDEPSNTALLDSHIERCINNPDEFKEERKNVIRDLYTYTDGKSAERAGKAMIKFLEEKCP